MTKHGVADNAILIRGKWIQIEPRKPRFPRALAAADRIVAKHLAEIRQRVMDGTLFEPSEQPKQ